MISSCTAEASNGRIDKLCGYTTWTLTKRSEKKLDGNYTRMLRAILNHSWGQDPTKHQLYSHVPPITKTIQARRTRHAGHCWKTCQRRWTIGRSGERGSGISVLAARHDNEDDCWGAHMLLPWNQAYYQGRHLMKFLLVAIATLSCAWNITYIYIYIVAERGGKASERERERERERETLISEKRVRQWTQNNQIQAVATTKNIV